MEKQHLFNLVAPCKYCRGNMVRDCDNRPCTYCEGGLVVARVSKQTQRYMLEIRRSDPDIYAKRVNALSAVQGVRRFYEITGAEIRTAREIRSGGEVLEIDWGAFADAFYRLQQEDQ